MKISKATALVKLYESAVQEYTKNPKEWKGLLTAIARYYKRSFDNTVLVYAQRPEFTQLATFDEWHDRRINRSINKGAKGIAVIDMGNPNASFKYLFDFLDTNGSVESFRTVVKYHWELESQYQAELMLRFARRFDTPTSGIGDCLNDYIMQRVTGNLPDLDVFPVKEQNSVLYGIPKEAVKAEFELLLTASVRYAVFYKCGISWEAADNDAFQNISHFNQLDLFMALGSSATAITRLILNEIYREIQTITR